MEPGGDVGLVVALQALWLFAVVLLPLPLVKLCLRIFKRGAGSGVESIEGGMARGLKT